MSTPDDESELNAEQIAQEFNRRAWRGRGDWRKMPPNGYLQGEHLETSNGDIVPINDSRALVLGWQAMEELAKLGGICPHCGARADLPPGHIERCYCLPVVRDLQAQVAALTAENERLSGKLTDAADTIRILHREKREDADVSEAEAIRLSTKIERLREPAVGTWQAMETAPKDGTSLLIAVENIVGEARFQGDGANEGWWWAGEDPGDYYADKIDVSPTGWMPLPKPPIADEGSEL